MIALYLKDYLLLGFLLLAEIAIMVYLLRNRRVSRKSRITLALLMVVGAAVGYLYTTGLITSQENLAAAIGAADTPSALIVSVSTLKLLGLLLPGIFGALGIGLAAAKPS